MNCPICNNDKFEIWELGIASILEEFPLINHERKIQTICCAKCNVLLYNHDSTPQWRDWSDTALFWNEEKQTLDFKKKPIVMKRVKSKDILESVPREYLIAALQEMTKKENK